MNRLALIAILTCASAAWASLGFVDFDGTETGLVGYTNSTYAYTGAGLGTNGALVTPGTATSGWSAGDSFWPMNRANVGPNTIGMPFAISDDSVVAAAGNTVFASDVLGFAGQTVTSGFFGVTDTENGVNSGPISADFVFSIAGASNLGLNVDLIAMGDFEAQDVFTFSYSIDGGGFTPIWTITADEAANLVYTMDSGATPALDDPLKLGAVYLNDAYQSFSAAIPGGGSLLTIRFTALTDGNEGFGFDNLGVTPEPASLSLLALGGLALIRRR